MHPLLGRGAWLGIYLAGWLLPGLLLAGLFVLSSDATWAIAAALAMPLAFLQAFLCLTSWYLCRGLPVGGTDLRRFAGTHAAAAVASSALWLAAGRLWAHAMPEMSDEIRAPEVFTKTVPALFAVGILFYLLGAAGHYVYIAFEQSRAAENRAMDLKLLAREAELRALRAQIDPHFLFNSLNSISSLAGSDAGAARRMAVLLADFLRTSLKLGKRDVVPLDEELRLATGYLAVEQIRFGARLRVEQAIEERARACPVPPLLLQPLVENAVTHGIAHLVDGGVIRVEARLERDDVVITLTNPVDPDRAASAGEGVGLSNVRRRLSTMYGPGARVHVARDTAAFRVELSIPVAKEA
ncbi:MAG: histidine kinase [Acidobacteria bacterium]|nr:histidine kinase [Acidobacteriota bacterium]